MKSDLASTFADALDANCGKTAVATLIEDISLAGVTEAVNLFVVETRARLLRMVASDDQPDRLRREAHSRKVTQARSVRPGWLALRRSSRRDCSWVDRRGRMTPMCQRQRSTHTWPT
ncbi:MAG TPA: hypothetical protein VFE41_05900 [Acetobacteraceae bacterium]|jgi:hypothetical protein|nr:hypothetical protein [Acetobacteraceae bacterium]